MTWARAPKTGVAVFSRFDSSRLPGKALRLVAGRALLCRVLDRVRLVPDTTVIVATSDRPVDDVIADTARAQGVGVFRGSVNDVAGRALACAEAFGLDRLVRVSGDSPFVPPELIAQMLDHPEGGADAMVTNLVQRTYPPGASIEILGIDFLRAMLAGSMDAEDREHVTRYAYRHPDAFRIVKVQAPDDRYRDVVLTLDDADDLARLTAIMGFLGDRAAFADLDAVVAAARAVALQ